MLRDGRTSFQEDQKLLLDEVKLNVGVFDSFVLGKPATLLCKLGQIFAPDNFDRLVKYFLFIKVFLS